MNPPTERAHIAGVLRESDPTECLLWVHAEAMADALLAAGYRREVAP